MGGPPRGSSDRNEFNSSILGTEIVHFTVGIEEREFAIHRKLIESSSDFFANIIASSSGPSLIPQPDFFSTTTGFVPVPPVPATASQAWSGDAYTILLPHESPTMFELFVLWLYQRSAGLRRFVDEATGGFGTMGTRLGRGHKAIASTCRALNLHYNLARLHVFAAKIGLEELQDVALDCLQDVFYRSDWSITSKFVQFVYSDRCGADSDDDNSFSLRMWAVAMMAWTLATKDVDLPSLCPGMTDETGGGSSRLGSMPVEHMAPIVRRFSALLVDTPDLLSDFSDHVSKLSKLKGSASHKNPSIRLPSNALKSNERQYGFRMCSFHSHRKEVGQGVCPHQTRISSRTLPAAGDTFYYAGSPNSGGTGATSRRSRSRSQSQSQSQGVRARRRDTFPGSASGSGSDSSSQSYPSRSADVRALFPCLANPGPLVRFDFDNDS